MFFVLRRKLLFDQLIHEGNQCTTRWLLNQYLPELEGSNVWSRDGACITTRRATRTGVPLDAACWRVVIEHPEQGWSYAVRAVWRGGRLMSPVATHCVIEAYFADDEGLVVDPQAACMAVNEWLLSL